MSSCLPAHSTHPWLANSTSTDVQLPACALQAPEGFNKQFAKYIKLISAMTRAVVDPLASVPFGRNMELIHAETVLPVRRAIAANISEASIHALMSRPDPRRPNLTLMQDLYDSGLRQCPLSGIPLFDPSQLDAKEQAILWRMLCSLPLALEDPEQAAEALKALEDVRTMVARRR